MFDTTALLAVALNATNSTVTTLVEGSSPLSRIVPNVIVSVSFVFALWTTISLIHYGILTGKWRQLKKQNLVEQLNFGHIHTSNVICGLMVLFYDTVGLIYINTGFSENGNHLTSLDDYCDSLSDLTYCAYACVLLSTALFLWLRQIIFFRNHQLNVNYNKCAIVFSYLSFFLTLALAIGVLIFTIYPNDHRSTMDGCVYVPNERLHVGYWVSATLAIVLCQGMFWGLFVYALKSTSNATEKNGSFRTKTCFGRRKPFQTNAKNKKLKVNFNDPAAPQSASNVTKDSMHTKTAPLSQRSRTLSVAVRSTMTKTLAVAITTTLLDLVEIVLLNQVNKLGNHHRFCVMLASINSFLHLFLTIMCFTHRKKMLMSNCWFWKIK